MKYVRVKLEFVVAADGHKDDPLPSISGEDLIDAIVPVIKASVPNAREILPDAKLELRRAAEPRVYRPRSFAEAMKRLHTKP